MHKDIHPLSGITVKLKISKEREHQLLKDGEEFWVEDWWDRLTGGSWMNAIGNPAAMFYGISSAQGNLPTDDEVIYGKIGALGYIVHQSEIGEIVKEGR